MISIDIHPSSFVWGANLGLWTALILMVILK